LLKSGLAAGHCDLAPAGRAPILARHQIIELAEDFSRAGDPGSDGMILLQRGAAWPAG